MTAAADHQEADTPVAAEKTRPGRLEQLLAEMRGGSSVAAQELIDTYGPHIRAVVQKKLADSLRPMFDSEDFVQSAWKSLIQMPAERIEEIHDPRQLVKLMATIAARKVIDEYRKRTNPGCNINRRRTLGHPEVVEVLAKIAGVNT
ncbi:MAG: hypothetical protein KY475_08460, partial [Planctomycetes bacterium]|nr:hypothetical protein [Planctomycetota bacterium]